MTFTRHYCDVRPTESVATLRGDRASATHFLSVRQVSGEIDQVFSGLSREAALALAEAQANDAAVASGARRETLKTLEIEDIPIAYLPGGARRVRVRVIGDIAFG